MIRYNNAAVGTYHIGIFSYMVISQYSVLAHLECSTSGSTAVVLTDGQPLNGHVDAGTVRYFKITLINTNYEFNVTAGC